jgi:3-oxoacyl-[acyl-carrier protein] reductase
VSGAVAGRVALVTGASRGIGHAIAVALGAAGAKVGALSTQRSGTKEVVELLVARGQPALSVAADVQDPKALDRAIDEVEKGLGPIDILVNNAGIALRASVAEMSDEDFDRVIRTNLGGPFYLARRIAPGMAKRGFGRVINVSSISSRLGTPKMSAYCASKWGLNGLTQALAEELRGSGVLVAAVLPGSVDTQMLVGSGFEPDMQPEEVARVVRFLCEEAPMAMTGSLVEVFG